MVTDINFTHGHSFSFLTTILTLLSPELLLPFLVMDTRFIFLHVFVVVDNFSSIHHSDNARQ
jgi:hypothetical protein